MSDINQGRKKPSRLLDDDNCGTASPVTLSLSPADLNRLGLVIAEKLAAQPLLVDSVELAPLLSVSVETVKRYTQSGQIPCVRIGRRVLYQPESVLAALQEATANEKRGADHG